MRRFCTLFILIIMTSLCACHTEAPQTTASVAPFYTSTPEEITPTAETTSTIALTPTIMLTATPTQTPTPIPTPVSAQELLKQMSVEEKVAQLFIVIPESLTSAKDSVTNVTQEIKDFLRHYPVGGVILFDANIKTPQQLKALTQDLRNTSKFPLLLAIDEEGGRVAKIANNVNFDVPRYPFILELGQENNPLLARELGVNIGAYLKEYGFNYNFAPVADVLTNPENTVIGNRSFGSDPQMVAQMVTNTITGLQEKGIGTCAKHFPGHGDTVSDTHKEGAIAPKTWQEMLNCELIPFKAAIEQGVDSIMIGHMTTPNVTSDGLPSSLSYEIITTRLRKELGFDGLVVTDALNMGAITNYYSAKDAAIKALMAGCDILLMPEDFQEAYEGVLNAVRGGTITQARLDESILRILTFKQKVVN